MSENSYDHEMTNLFGQLLGAFDSLEGWAVSKSLKPVKEKHLEQSRSLLHEIQRKHWYKMKELGKQIDDLTNGTGS
jgi:hypothetical protein